MTIGTIAILEKKGAEVSEKRAHDRIRRGTIGSQSVQPSWYSSFAANP